MYVKTQKLDLCHKCHKHTVHIWLKSAGNWPPEIGCQKSAVGHQPPEISQFSPKTMIFFKNNNFQTVVQYFSFANIFITVLQSFAITEALFFCIGISFGFQNSD